MEIDGEYEAVDEGLVTDKGVLVFGPDTWEIEIRGDWIIGG